MIQIVSTQEQKIVGRFAPSPTGPLHFGTLVAALGSYLLARQGQGRWLLRMEDLDPPRVVPGAADTMLELLAGLGFEWDGEILYQSQRTARYREILQQLQAEGRVFECSCTRREILASAPHPGEEGPVYPGTCRAGAEGSRPERALRLRVDDRQISCEDGIFGRQSQNLQDSVGDFILHRVDGLYAYQLAVVVDDIDSGVNQVVRGADLLSSTPRQAFLYDCLQQPRPKYFHLPLALGASAEKLSKRHGKGGLVTAENGSDALWQALLFLNQQPPEDLRLASPGEILSWGRAYFSVAAIPTESKPAPELFPRC